MIKTTTTVETRYSFNGADLAAERERVGLSQSRLAEITGIDRCNISAYERPYQVTICQETKDKLARAGIDFESTKK